MRVLPVIALMSPHASPIIVSEVIRHRVAGSELPVALAVEVPPGASMLHLSSVTPPDGAAADTRGQTRAVLHRIESALRDMELGLGDIVRLRVFLATDPLLGEADYAGFNAAYREFFGTARQPHLPARSVLRVAALAEPGWLVEIEASAARMRR